MKLLYKPFAIIAGLIAARIGQSVFKQLWAQIDAEEPPKPTERDTSLGKVVGAAGLEAATMAVAGAVADRASAKWFHYLTGFWPGPKRKEEKGE